MMELKQTVDSKRYQYLSVSESELYGIHKDSDAPASVNIVKLIKTIASLRYAAHRGS